MSGIKLYLNDIYIPDSDSTWPATDDFGSRFLEIDEYECSQYNQVPRLPRQRAFSKQAADADAVPVKRNEARRTRGVRVRSYLAMEEGRDESDVDEVGGVSLPGLRSRRTSGYSRTKLDQNSEEVEDDDPEISSFQKPRLLTARQLSLQRHRAATVDTVTHSGIKQHSGPESDLLTLESLEAPRRITSPTPEQLDARQRNIARRRESAKHRAELQKRQTVERLLKVNADSEGFMKRSRGRGARGGTRGFSHSASATSLLSVSSNMSGIYDESESSTAAITARVDEDDEDSGQDTATEALDLDLIARISLAKQHGLSDSLMDPSRDHIRCISSIRLSPSNRVCFPPNIDAALSMSTSKEPPPVPPTRLCGLGCGRPRRYTCSTTGVPLCSLACYRQNIVNVAKQNNTALVSR
ncbi:HIT zinc finger, partial [Opisthorchis viverrini]